MSDRATAGIALYDSLWGKASNWRNLYQDAADLMFPRENQINAMREPGREVGTDIIDPTGVMASIEMASGLSVNLFPSGQKFYNVLMQDKELNKVDEIKRALGRVTEISHEARANSNFMLQANETLRALSVFGTGNMFSEYIPGVGLNYRDYDVATYVFTENALGRVDGMYIEFPFTARQAFAKWGDKAGETVLKKMENPLTENDTLLFIWIVRPRDKKNQTGDLAVNMAVESLFISRPDKEIVEESGFEEFPFQTPRWTKSSGEKWGRGQGTFALGTVRTLQQERRGLTDSAELHNNPPKEVLESFEGIVRIRAGDLNYVPQLGSIKAIEQQALGNYTITKDIIEMDRDEVKKLMFNDVFVQLRDLKGDRRTTIEIRARLAEGLRRLGPPIGRLQTEWLTPLVERDIGLLQRNGEFGELPPEMQGQKFKIEYVGRLALELKSAQSVGWSQWVAEGAEIETATPGIGVLDNVDIDGGYRNRGISLGVSVDDMASEDEVAEKRELRAEREAEERAVEIAKAAGPAYVSSTKAPEPNSPAEAVLS